MLYSKLIISVKQLHEIGQFNLSCQMLLHFIHFGVNNTICSQLAQIMLQSKYVINILDM